MTKHGLIPTPRKGYWKGHGSEFLDDAGHFGTISTDDDAGKVSLLLSASFTKDGDDTCPLGLSQTHAAELWPIIKRFAETGSIAEPAKEDVDRRLWDRYFGLAMQPIASDILIDNGREAFLLKNGVTENELPAFLAHLAAEVADAMIAEKRKRESRTDDAPPPVDNGIADLVDALESIAIYGSDTLSGKADGGPDDREWYRESVIEMVKRARGGLSKARAAK